MIWLADAVLRREPHDAEFEISIFGPGKGEAIAVHLGGGDWITVDSCRDQTTGENAVLTYFSEIGVDPATALRLVVGTHAHDDHIAGISEIYAAACSAQFVTSRAVTSTEFYATLEADADIEKQLRQAVRKEYRKVFTEVESRGKLSDGRRPMLSAWEQRELWSRPETDQHASARVLALSPSEDAVDRSLAILAEGSARADSRRRLSAGDPNEYAVALWVEVGDVAILLGADLVIGPEGCGWKAVLQTHIVETKASIHKVPHHGSPNAHHAPVWSRLLTPDVISLLAPFRAGTNPRPNPSDVSRIVGLSGAAYSTAKVGMPAQGRATRKTQATLAGLALNVREPYGQVGHVRARRDGGDSEWVVEVFAPGLQLH